jgi:hypothetical protein
MEGGAPIPDIRLKTFTAEALRKSSFIFYCACGATNIIQSFSLRLCASAVKNFVAFQSTQ